MDSRQVVPPEDLLVHDEPMPECVGPYRLIRPLGTGGMGTVYEARDTTSGRHVALKLLAAHSAGTPEALERFRQEGRLASQIAHPRCVLVLAADEAASRPYIAMELMSGQTLRDLVQQQGPLPPEQAVAKVLDVLEGLQEAHGLGVIHRDVKPSNCFLVADGRVKVGDFGLAKSLSSDVQLTRSGAFVGTPLFASPEQIKGEPTDFRTDVFSLAATLYYLLTGKAPFQQANATATLARIVSEPAPSLRTHRPDISPALDRVVLKGLHRYRNRRWRNLEEFRQALLPFMPEHSSRGSVGARVGALLLDTACFLPLWLLTRFLATLLSGGWVWAAKTAVDTLPWLAYFIFLEGLWSGSLGKRWVGLRVWTAGGSDPPGLRRGLVRTLVFYACTGLSWDVLALASGVGDASHWGIAWPFALTVAGLGVMIAPVRAANGYRCLHEWLSGTRVVALPPTPKRRPLESLHDNSGEWRLATAESPLLEAVGPYHVRGRLPARHGLVLLGEDGALGRDVFLHLRPAGEPPLPDVRREVDRPTRPRWLTSGQQEPWQWDAFLMAGGCPLADVVDAAHRLDWEDLRPLLQQLAEELAAGCRDGSLPEVLTTSQVWVEPDGQVVLLDWPGPSPEEPEGTGLPPQQRALALLGRVAVLALEGRPGAATLAPVPSYARAILDRLLGVTPPYLSVDQFLADLAATRGRPARVTVRMRAVHLTALAAALAVGVVSMFLSSSTFSLWYDLEVARVMPGRMALAQKAVALLDRPADLEKIRLELPPELAARVEGPADRDQLKQLLQEQMSRDDQANRRAVESLGWWGRLFGIDEWAKGKVEPHLSPQAFTELVRRAGPANEAVAVSGPDVERSTTLERILVGLSLWPILWLVAAVLFRGGATLPLLGLALVGPDGRNAARWRCAWRTFLIWAPVTLLLSLSVWLASGGAAGWAVVGHLLWWAAGGLLIVYVLLALRWPAHGPHDRLAGTYLVPR